MEWQAKTYTQEIALPRDGIAGAWDRLVAFLTRSPRRMGTRRVTVTLHVAPSQGGGLYLAAVQAEVSP